MFKYCPIRLCYDKKNLNTAFVGSVKQNKKKAFKREQDPWDHTMNLSFLSSFNWEVPQNI